LSIYASISYNEKNNLCEERGGLLSSFSDNITYTFAKFMSYLESSFTKIFWQTDIGVCLLGLTWMGGSFLSIHDVTAKVTRLVNGRPLMEILFIYVYNVI
jgi:hypothetical protein